MTLRQAPYRAAAAFRRLHESGVIATVALDPPAEPTMSVVLSDGSVRQCPATDRGFASLLAARKAEQDLEDAS